MTQVEMTQAETSLERRLEAASELALQIAAGDLGARLAISVQGDAIDAVVVALNMLAEELADERKSRQRAEELLQDEIDAYETAPALFCSLDGESLVVENCNATLARALGMAKAEILGRSILRLYSVECRDAAELWLRAVPPGGTENGVEASLSRAGGGSVIVSTGASRLAGSEASGGRERLRVVFRDVTTERHLESQLAQAQKLEAIGRLSSGVAHDFNNILSVVTGAAALLSDLLASHSIESEDIQLIEQAVSRGASLTSDLLAFSRRQVGRPVSTDVRQVVGEAQRMIERLVGEHILVSSHFPGDSVNVLIDASQLSQVLINLAINARDAMSGGGRLLMTVAKVSDLDVDADLLDLPSGAYAKLCVVDTGSGMSVEVRERAFEPFFTTKPPGKGTGLGLSVCYGIIRQAGGRIVLLSEAGRGTTVEMYLPLAVAAAAPRPLSTPAQPIGGRETILVVEDDASVRTVTRRVLERAGYQVVVAADGVEALRVVERLDGEIGAVVTDVTMPGMGGFELGAELRRRRPRTRMLYLSGYVENLAAIRGPIEPCSDFLGKPFTASSLLGRLRRLLDQRWSTPPR
jgi:two-component system cell cycle sensor histidine kinase/response regulator CckA